MTDVLAYFLLSRDYEKDDYSTSYITTTIVNTRRNYCWKNFGGKLFHISTYEHIKPEEIEFIASTLEETSKFIMDTRESQTLIIQLLLKKHFER